MRARDRWGHVIDLTLTVTLVIPDGLNWHRLDVPALNKDFAHLQPGDTRFLALDTLGLSAAAQDILRTAAKARNYALRLESTDLLDQLHDWAGCYVLVEAIGNDAWSAGRRCWEQRYALSGASTALRAGTFPVGPHSDRAPCNQPNMPAPRTPAPPASSSP